jgi:hypothetical protein
MFPDLPSVILELRIREAFVMEMNYLALQYIWNSKQEEMQRRALFKERYKLYPEIHGFKWISALRRMKG